MAAHVISIIFASAHSVNWNDNGLWEVLQDSVSKLIKMWAP